MSLDKLVSADDGRLPVLCLPHQCEFLSDQWLDWAREFLSQKAPQFSNLPEFSIVERFSQAPPHLGFCRRCSAVVSGLRWSAD